MENRITINRSSCVKCGRCVKVCPSLVFSDLMGDVEVAQAEGCIACGHCVVSCPEGAVSHSKFPKGSVHRIDRAKLPQPEQVKELILSRRSHRVFSAKNQVPSQLLELILEAAHAAPTASNLQKVEFTLVTSQSMMTELSGLTIDLFAKIVRMVDRPVLRSILKKYKPDIYRYIPVFKRLRREYEQGNDMILRGATALLVIHTPSNCRFGCQDSNLAYQNASLMAESLGVGHFYAGFLYSATVQRGGDQIARKLGIKGTIHAAMALGMPKYKYEKYMDKNPIKLTRIK